MGLEGLAIALRVGVQTPAVLHSAHAGFASAAAIAALLLPDSPVHCDAPPPRSWYAGVPEPFPAAAFQGDFADRSYVLNKELRPSGTVVSSIADAPSGISYVKASTVPVCLHGSPTEGYLAATGRRARCRRN